MSFSSAHVFITVQKIFSNYPWKLPLSNNYQEKKREEREREREGWGEEPPRGREALLCQGEENKEKSAQLQRAHFHNCPVTLAK